MRRYHFMSNSIKPPPADFAVIELQKTDNAVKAMESIGISDDEVKMVVHHGEATGEKLYVPGEERFLAKANIGERTVYVEYSPIADKNAAYTIHTAYAYRAKPKEG